MAIAAQSLSSYGKALGKVDFVHNIALDGKGQSTWPK